MIEVIQQMAEMVQALKEPENKAQLETVLSDGMGIIANIIHAVATSDATIDCCRDIATLSAQLKSQFMNQGFTADQSVQLIAAMLGKKQ